MHPLYSVKLTRLQTQAALPVKTSLHSPGFAAIPRADTFALQADIVAIHA